MTEACENADPVRMSTSSTTVICNTSCRNDLRHKEDARTTDKQHESYCPANVERKVIYDQSFYSQLCPKLKAKSGVVSRMRDLVNV